MLETIIETVHTAGVYVALLYTAQISDMNATNN